jgi:hypothetical protein
VVQSSIAKWILAKQLKAVGILSEKENVDDHESMMKEFRESELFISSDHFRF